MVEEDSIPDDLWISGVDPGQKDIVAMCTEKFEEKNFREPNHPRTFTKSISATSNRHNILKGHFLQSGTRAT